MAQSTTPTSHLNIPPSSRMPRSSSHESFATDVSLLSLSSFTTDMPFDERRRSTNVRSTVDDDAELDLDKDSDLAQFRENMFEKMLESHSLAMPKMTKGRQGQSSSKKVYSSPGSKKQQTEEDYLFEKCLLREPKIRGSLYKSFSTTDMPSKSWFDVNANVVKRVTSQIWIPNDYVQLIHCRKEHLKDLNLDDFKYCNKDYLTPTETESNTECSFSSPTTIGKDKDDKVNSFDVLLNKNNRSSNAGIFMKKFKFSKEIGRRIRDDLVRKLSKRKEQKITKSDLDSEKGRPLNKYERNYMIFHWLQSLHEDSFDDP